ncbi:MAG TPA: hypothetical protein VNJ02_06445 [Vicinamibacterales bacterium]|nr:hypothetical protein [Vicinamibacterales bacterium]
MKTPISDYTVAVARLFPCGLAAVGREQDRRAPARRRQDDALTRGAGRPPFGGRFS